MKNGYELHHYFRLSISSITKEMNNLKKMEENGGELPTLAPKQVQTLIAIVTSKTDTEAIAKCPYGETHFYRLKPLLIKYRDWLLGKSLQQAQEILQVASPEAAITLYEGLSDKQNKYDNAKAILDRAGVSKNTKMTGVSVKDGDKEIKLIIEDYI